MALKISDYGYNSLMIETKSSCNMKCKFCPYPMIEDTKSELPSVDVFKIIDSIDPNDQKFNIIYLHGFNEPLLDPRIFEFVGYVKSRGLNVQITTNGLLFNSQKIRTDLIDSEPTCIRISLQTLNKTNFVEARGIQYSFDTFKAGIFQFLDDALRLGSKTDIVMDVGCNFQSHENQLIRKILGIEYGEPSMPDTIQTIQEDLIFFLKDLNTFNSSFNYDEDKIKKYLKTANPDYEKQPGIPLAGNISIKVKPFFYGRRLSDFYPAIKPNGCGTDTLMINVKGSVAPCCLIYNNLINMGNIKEESLQSILERNKVFLSNIKNGICMPDICRKCKGAPTKRGVFMMAVYKFLKEKGNLLNKNASK